jgi:hypothetical protein
VRINEASDLLTSVYIDWSHILANPRGIRKDSRITWDRRVPKMLKLPVMISDIIDLVNDGQYTFQIIEDGSIIQLYYQYDSKGNELKSACLAFYSTVVQKNKISSTSRTDLEAEINDIDAFDENIQDEQLLKEIDEQIPVSNNKLASWLRIDYDPQHAVGVLHHDCHMHLSAFPYARLVVAGVPNPKQFVEFIMALCYPKIYAKHRLDGNGQYTNEQHILAVNSKCVPLTDHEVFRQMAHFRIPIDLENRRR